MRESIDVRSVHHLEIFSKEGKILSETLIPRVLWSEAKHAALHRSSAPFRDATPGSALCHLRDIHSNIEDGNRELVSDEDF